MLSEHSILRALRLYYTSAFKDFLKIVLGGHSAFVQISGCKTVVSISAQYVLTRARAIHAPSMHADLFIALIHGTASRNCCTKLK